MKITVTQEHIDRARDHQSLSGFSVCTQCPVATALREHYPNASVGKMYTGAVIFLNDLAEEIEIEEVTEFVRAFDAYLPVQPFSFELPEEP